MEKERRGCEEISETETKRQGAERQSTDLAAPATSPSERHEAQVHVTTRHASTRASVFSGDAEVRWVLTF